MSAENTHHLIVDDYVNLIGKDGVIHTKLPKDRYKAEYSMTTGWILKRVYENREHIIKQRSLEKLGEDKERILNMFCPQVIDLYRALDIKNSRALLLHGPQGTGKTTIAQTVAAYLSDKFDACIFEVDNTDELRAIVSIIPVIRRKTEHFKAIIIVDECEYIMKNSSSFMKNLLDGPNTLDDCFYLFMTNHVEEIPNTIRFRPSRIQYSISIGSLSESECLEICESILAKSKLFKTKNEIIGRAESIVANLDASPTVDDIKMATVRLLESYVMEPVDVEDKTILAGATEDTK